jgi:hypothetical protein
VDLSGLPKSAPWLDARTISLTLRPVTLIAVFLRGES